MDPTSHYDLLVVVAVFGVFQVAWPASLLKRPGSCVTLFDSDRRGLI
jgi:hypothetical protein